MKGANQESRLSTKGYPLFKTHIHFQRGCCDKRARAPLLGVHWEAAPPKPQKGSLKCLRVGLAILCPKTMGSPDFIGLGC